LLGGLAAVLLGLLALMISSASWMIACSAVLLGAGSAAWLLGRQSYVTDTSAPEEFGRAITVMAGLQRVGAFIGPASGGVVAELAGYPVAFLCGAGCATLAGVLVWIYTRNVPHRAEQEDLTFAGTVKVVRVHARVLATAGVASLTLQLMRSSRQVLVTLFGRELGLDAAAIGAVYSLSAAVDMSLFYPVGVIADRWGRKHIAVPSMVLFVIGHAFLPFVWDFYSYLGASLLLGLANGIGTGIVMIIGSDLAPENAQGQFLGVWRLMGDTGLTSGPLLAGLLVSFASLGAAGLAVAGLGLIGAVLTIFVVPETLRRSVPIERDASRPARDNEAADAGERKRAQRRR
jgi:MFS family permease